MKLYIKYMVSLQSKAVMKLELDRLDIPFSSIENGMVQLRSDVTLIKRNQLKINLLQCGLKLHESKKGLLVENIKRNIIEMIGYADGNPVLSHSIYLSKKLDYDYTYLANIFSEVNGISIQQFIILSKIEMVKEYLLFTNINLSEISYRLHYSSVAHLSGQFKKVTGITPSSYKLLGKKKM